MDIFANDRAWNLKKTKENYDWEQWHLKRSQEAIHKKDMTAAKNQATHAKSYHSTVIYYKRDAQKSTK